MIREHDTATFHPPARCAHADDRFEDTPRTDDLSYPPRTFDASRPLAARVRNYPQGGKDSFPIDREHADQLVSIFPGVIDVTRASRGFPVRAVTYLAAEAGVRQFVDIGPGLPAKHNMHDRPADRAGSV
ncbi:SAM-dependent methyltransferase [Parafrankia sp. FMc2]|uniref:SAM-dependent methyltransferase n=1 Tax=Parafrankia sp. FMc2 TaxID=3233196 RepID=UPI0034D5F4B3